MCVWGGVNSERVSNAVKTFSKRKFLISLVVEYRVIVGELRNDGSVRRRKSIITMPAEAVWRVRGGERGRGGGTGGGDLRALQGFMVV